MFQVLLNGLLMKMHKISNTLSLNLHKSLMFLMTISILVQLLFRQVGHHLIAYLLGKIFLFFKSSD